MIVDVRDYRLAPGKRDLLIERCEALFFPEQERLGARFVGSFRDADDPDRFLFLRAMPDLDTRRRVMTAFYSDGEMWRRHREEVNTWLVDTDDVLLVHPISAWAEPSPGSSSVAMYSHLRRAPLADPAALRAEVERAIASIGGRLLVTFETDPAENNYPAHPIRTDEHGLLWFASLASHRPLSVDGIIERRLAPTATSRLR